MIKSIKSINSKVIKDTATNTVLLVIIHTITVLCVLVYGLMISIGM